MTADWQQCPFCREALPPAPLIAPPSRPPASRGKIREGLLCVLLAAIVHYFAGGYSTMNLPFPVQPFVTIYLSPLLLLCGIGLILHSFLQHLKAAS